MADNSDDPYAAARGNLRDTVKWMAAAFSGLAAAVLAGTSISGISGLTGPALLGAVVTGALGLTFILIAIGLLLQLLRTPTFFLDQLRTEARFDVIKAGLNAHKDDLLSPVFADIQDFLVKRKTAIDAIRRIPENDPDQARRDTRAAALAFYDRIAGESARLSSLAQLEALSADVGRVEHRLFGLAILALITLGGFAVITGKDKDDTPKGPTLTLAPGKAWSNLSGPLAAACGETPVKAEIAGTPQTGWLELRLLSPQACAGMHISVPANALKAAK